MKEPELVISGLSFIIPASVAWRGEQWVSAGLLSLLIVTSTIWHTFHEEWFRPFDFAAIVSVLTFELYNSFNTGIDVIVFGLLTCVYGFIAYYWGYIDSTFCFAETRSNQMIFHAVLHVLASITITLNLLKLQENEKTSTHTKSFS